MASMHAKARQGGMALCLAVWGDEEAMGLSQVACDLFLIRTNISSSKQGRSVVNSQCWALRPNIGTFGVMVIMLGCHARG